MSNGFALDNSSSLSLELTFTQSLCQTIDTPRSLAIYLMIEHKMFAEICSLECDPGNYLDHTSFRDDYLVTEVLQKSPNLPLGIDRKAKAVSAFFDAEVCCMEKNRELTSLSVGDLPLWVWSVQSIIRRILGPLSRNVLEEIQDSFRFGPGVTTGVNGRGIVPSDKYDAEMHLTLELMPFYRAILGDRWWDISSHPTIVEGNKFTCVPKNAKTDRGICIEPTLNIYAQLGLGTFLKKRLKFFGIDLYSQERNRSLAASAYDKGLATIDLSMASDSLSWGAVLLLLPPDWFSLFELFRSSRVNLEGVSIELNKFSSMGNGYTFELESLIFAAVVQSIVPREKQTLCSVYGDDIIVPAEFAQKVIEVLEFLGFKTNAKKSFLAGNFFESCGTDWFCGQPVRPFYLRGSKDSIPYALQIANSLRLYSNRISHGEFCDRRFLPLWRSLKGLIPSDWRSCRIPASFGDTGLISSHSESRSKSPRGWLQGLVVRHMVFSPVYKTKRTVGRLLCALACPVPEVFTKGREPRRGFLRRPRPKKTIVFQWSEGFDWL